MSSRDKTISDKFYTRLLHYEIIINSDSGDLPKIVYGGYITCGLYHDQSINILENGSIFETRKAF